MSVIAQIHNRRLILNHGMSQIFNPMYPIEYD